MATDDKKTNATSSATDGDDKVKKLEEMVNKQTEQIADLTEKLSTAQSQIISPQYQEYIQSRNQPAGKFEGSDFAAGRTGEIDLESMDRKEFMTHMLGEIDKRVSPRIDQVTQDVRQDRIDRGIDSAQKTYSDFKNYERNMGQDASRINRGGLTAEDVYLMQKGREFVKSLTDKDTEPKPDTTKTEKPGTAGEAPTTTEKMTPRQIAEKVYDEMEIDEKFPPPK